MTCTYCGFALDLGYQSSDNLNLCQTCLDYSKQGGDYELGERDEEDESDRAAREEYEDDRTTFDMSDDADALASAGWGTDEDYGYYGGED